MEIYCINGFAPDSETERIQLVCEVYATKEKAEEAMNELILTSRQFAQEVESIKASITGKGTWTEKTSDVHGSRYLFKEYACEVSIDLEDEQALDYFKQKSAVGLLGGTFGISITNGITISRMYSALPFPIAQLKLTRKEI